MTLLILKYVDLFLYMIVCLYCVSKTKLTIMSGVEAIDREAQRRKKALEGEQH